MSSSMVAQRAQRVEHRLRVAGHGHRRVSGLEVVHAELPCSRSTMMQSAVPNWSSICTNSEKSTRVSTSMRWPMPILRTVST